MLKEEIVLKHIIRDTVIVFISCILGLFILGQVNTEMSSKVPSIFTGKPDF